MPIPVFTNTATISNSISAVQTATVSANVKVPLLRWSQAKAPLLNGYNWHLFGNSRPSHPPIPTPVSPGRSSGPRRRRARRERNRQRHLVSRQLSGQRPPIMKPTLLIVDDDEDIRTQMKWALAAEYEVVMAGDRAGAVAAFETNRPLVTLLDLGLPPRPNDPEEGLATLSSLLALDPSAKVIIVSGQGDKQNALRAVGSGAYDFLCKPVQMDELKLVLQRCGLRRRARAVNIARRWKHSVPKCSKTCWARARRCRPCSPLSERSLRPLRRC